MSNQEGRKSKEKDVIPIATAAAGRKKTTDELIEEYERKINNTKSLLEEEKKRVLNKIAEEGDYPVESDENAISQQELLNNLTPEFKSKQPLRDQNIAANKP